MVALEALREGIEPTAKNGAAHRDDCDLGIHFTSGRDDGDEPLGTVAVVLGPSGPKREVWRFGDTAPSPVELVRARRFD